MNDNSLVRVLQQQGFEGLMRHLESDQKLKRFAYNGEGSIGLALKNHATSLLSKGKSKATVAQEMNITVSQLDQLLGG